MVTQVQQNSIGEAISNLIEIGGELRAAISTVSTEQGSFRAYLEEIDERVAVVIRDLEEEFGFEHE